MKAWRRWQDFATHGVRHHSFGVALTAGVMAEDDGGLQIAILEVRSIKPDSVGD